jgi:putative ABC transport system permease protein
VTLGAGLPFARLGRAALTAASVATGVAVITLSVGTTASVVAFRDLASPHVDGRVIVSAAEGQAGPGSSLGAPSLKDPSLASELAALPDVLEIGAALHTTVRVDGSDLPSMVRFYRVDAALLPAVSAGRQPSGAGEATAAAKFLARSGLHLGDTVTIGYRGASRAVTIVGVMMSMTTGELTLPWSTLTQLDPDALPSEYQVQLGGDGERAAFADALARVHPELYVGAPRENSSDQAAAIVGGVIVLGVILALVSAIGVFNTALLTVHERRRDLGTLKSIGMTPRQTVALFVTSTAVPGVLGGVVGALLGLIAHRVLVPLVTRSGPASFASDLLLAAFTWPRALPLALVGIVIAVVGAVVPARRAARTPISVALRDE